MGAADSGDNAAYLHQDLFHLIALFSHSRLIHIIIKMCIITALSSVCLTPA